MAFRKQEDPRIPDGRRDAGRHGNGPCIRRGCGADARRAYPGTVDGTGDHGGIAIGSGR